MAGGRWSRRAVLQGGAVAGLTGLLAACGDGDQARHLSSSLPAQQDPAPSISPTVTRALSGAITVVYADELGKKPGFVEAAARAVEQAHPATTVSIVRHRLGSNEFFEQLLPALRSDDAPDVIHVGGDRLGELADAGLIISLDAYLAEWPDWRYYSPTVRDGVTYQGQTWALPYGLDTRFLYFRRDIFQQAGLPPDWQPRNVADILTAAERVRSRRTDVMPYALYAGVAGGSGTANHGFVPLVYAYGGSLKDPRGNWIGDSPAIRKALAYYHAAYRTTGLVAPDLLDLPRAWVEMRERLGDGRLAMLYEGGWVYGGWADKDKAGTAQNIGYLLFPTEYEGPSFTLGGPGTCWYITAAGRNKDLAWQFIATWNSRDTVGRLNAEDPHPVARVDAVRVPEYRQERFLVDSTESLRRAYSVPPDAAYGAVVGVIQSITAGVARGEMSPEEAASRYTQDLRQIVGPNRVTLQG
jgi:multiple sugar transport system substrate-binding protein